MSKKQFWDIEAYENYFCCGFVDEYDFLEMHYIVTNDDDRKEVIRACEDSGLEYVAYDLTKDATVFIEHFRKIIPSDGKSSLLSDFLGITEEVVLPKEDVYISFNGISYDIQMIDKITQSILSGKVQTTPETLRLYSDSLIDNTARRVPTLPYELYANQVDAAYLNETMMEEKRPTIGLKTLIGTKGGSIIESESNTSGVSNDIYGDTLYNINDCKELKDVVFPGKLEQTLTIRQALLKKYPSLRENKVTPNSTSAQFVENIVAPYEPIDDDPVVSFMYPAKHIAEEKGVEQMDMLEYTKEWYIENVFKVIMKRNPAAAKKHLAKFMTIYDFYASIRGKNWNSSARHFMKYGIDPLPKTERRALMGRYGTYLPMIDKNGIDSYTYVNFSLGGIHGAEVFATQLEQDRAEIRELREKYGKISQIPKGKVSTALLNLIKAQSRTQYNGFPQSLSHEIPYFFKNTEEVDDILDPEEFTPFMYQQKYDVEKLIKRYRYTSAGESVHQDFAGYYPMLLINMGAFYDGNGHDPYHEVYKLRISVKKKLKTLEYLSPEWIATNIEQEGYKLILNSASGILDGNHDTKLRANNKAMTMRIIGQLMTYIIAAALAIEGARIPSSNTDGIYVFDIDYDLNEEIVSRELKKLYVEIDPEPVFIVSKDTNNRMGAKRSQVSNYYNVVSDIVA